MDHCKCHSHSQGCSSNEMLLLPHASLLFIYLFLSQTRAAPEHSKWWCMAGAGKRKQMTGLCKPVSLCNICCCLEVVGFMKNLGCALVGTMIWRNEPHEWLSGSGYDSSTMTQLWTYLMYCGGHWRSGSIGRPFPFSWYHENLLSYIIQSWRKHPLDWLFGDKQPLQRSKNIFFATMNIKCRCTVGVCIEPKRFPHHSRGFIILWQ